MIQRELEAMDRATHDPDEHSTLPFLRLLSPEQLSRITITEFLRMPDVKSEALVDEGANTTVKVMVGIGKSIETEYNLQMVQSKKNRQMVNSVS
jgi:DNA-directed RNA polymerase